MTNTVPIEVYCEEWKKQFEACKSMLIKVYIVVLADATKWSYCGSKMIIFMLHSCSRTRFLLHSCSRMHIFLLQELLQNLFDLPTPVNKFYVFLVNLRKKKLFS